MKLSSRLILGVSLLLCRVIFAQAPAIDLRVQPINGALYLSGNFGVTTNALVVIQSAPELSLLGDPAAHLEYVILTNAAVFQSVVEAGEARMFISAEAQGLDDVGDVELPQLDGDDVGTDVWTDLWVFGDEVIEGGMPYHLHVEVIAEAGNRIPVSGTLVFQIVDDASGNPAAGFSVRPDQARLTEGLFDNLITIDGPAGPHPELSLEVEFTETAAAPAQAHPAGTPKKGTRKKAVKKPLCVIAVGDDWKHPLGASGSSIGLGGTFGEWPGHAAIHAGVDFSAGAGTEVFAARPGRVFRNSAEPKDPSNTKGVANTISGVGGRITIRHADGSVTRYLHVSPQADLKVDDCVDQGQLIAKIGSFPPVGIHLHFEILRLAGAVNPADLIPAISQGDTAAPQVTSILLRADNLATAVVGRRQEPVPQELSSTLFVSLGIPDFDSRGSAESRLAPRRVEFQPAGKAALVFDLVDLPTIKQGFHNPATFGYPALTAAEKELKIIRYQYWFPWNLERSGQELSGPARFDLKAKDVAGNELTSQFVLGPEIMDKAALAHVSTPTATVGLKANLGPFPAGQKGVDKLTELLDLEIKSLDIGSASPAVFATNKSPRISLRVPANQATNVVVQLPDKLSLPPTAHFRLEVRSHRRPTVGDFVEIQASAGGITGARLKLTSVASGTTWAVPATVELRVTQSATALFTGSNRKQERGSPFYSGEPATAGAIFYECDTVTGFPQRGGGPFINRLGASSFIAVKTGDDGRRQIWINASVGAWRIDGGSGIISDWEYQARYHTTDFDKKSGQSMQIGTVPNANFFGGQDVTGFEVELIE